MRLRRSGIQPCCGFSLVRGQHRVVELLEEGVVFLLTIGGGEAEGFDALDENLVDAGLGLDGGIRPVGGLCLCFRR